LSSRKEHFLPAFAPGTPRFAERRASRVLTLSEQLNLALARRYASSSEKFSPDQTCLFDEAETDGETVSAVDGDADAHDDEVVVAACTTCTMNGRG